MSRTKGTFYLKQIFAIVLIKNFLYNVLFAFGILIIKKNRDKNLSFCLT